jgi:hypothetical protein
MSFLHGIIRRLQERLILMRQDTNNCTNTLKHILVIRLWYVLNKTKTKLASLVICKQTDLNEVFLAS